MNKVKVKKGREELELENDKPVLFGGDSRLAFEGTRKFSGVAFFSVRSEGLAAYMRELGLPLRKDSAETSKPLPAISGKLSDANLVSYGFEQ